MQGSAADQELLPKSGADRRRQIKQVILISCRQEAGRLRPRGRHHDLAGRAAGLTCVMQNIISLDGTSARRFGQVLLVGSRINGHNVALAAILGRTENGLNYSRLLGALFSVVPEMAARPPTVVSDRGRRDHSRR